MFADTDWRRTCRLTSSCPPWSSCTMDLCLSRWVNQAPNSCSPRAASHEALSDNLIPKSRKLRSATRREQPQRKAQPVPGVPAAVRKLCANFSSALRSGLVLYAMSKWAHSSRVPATLSWCNKALGPWVQSGAMFHLQLWPVQHNFQWSGKPARNQTEH